jgi:hypothetical protein
MSSNQITMPANTTNPKIMMGTKDILTLLGKLKI